MERRVQACPHHVDEIIAVEPPFDALIDAEKAIVETFQRVAAPFDLREIRSEDDHLLP
jgi:hypothetical protein